MTQLIARRLVLAVFTLFVVLTFVFMIVRVSGDPVVYLLPFDFTAEQEQRVRENLGLDKPIIQQYAIFLGDFIQGKMGDSHRWKTDAFGLVADRLPATLSLAAVAFVMSVVISLPLGMLAAVKRDGAIDAGVRVFATAGQALPNFILAILLIQLIGVELRWLPVGGYGGIGNYILPAVSLAWFSMAAQTRIVRSSMADVLSTDYVRTARAKGLAPLTVLVRHALRSALVPILTMIGLQWAFFLGGTVVIETVFAWPGVGRLMVEAVTARDYAIVQAGTVVFSALFILINLITDLSYLVVDPRTRAQ